MPVPRKMTFTEATIGKPLLIGSKISALCMIRMILGLTMREGMRVLSARNHSAHFIREIKAPHVLGGVVPDDKG